MLDTNLTPGLIEEGFVREVISKVQTMRKDAGFEVMDHIRLSVKDNDKIIEIIKNNEDIVKSEVLANEAVYGTAEGFTKEWNINGGESSSWCRKNCNKYKFLLPRRQSCNKQICLYGSKSRKKGGCICIRLNSHSIYNKKKGVAPQQRELLWGQMKKMKKNLFQTLVNKLFIYQALLAVIIISYRYGYII